MVILELEFLEHVGDKKRARDIHSDLHSDGEQEQSPRGAARKPMPLLAQGKKSHLRRNGAGFTLQRQTNCRDDAADHGHAKQDRKDRNVVSARLASSQGEASGQKPNEGGHLTEDRPTGKKLGTDVTGNDRPLPGVPRRARS